MIVLPDSVPRARLPYWRERENPVRNEKRLPDALVAGIQPNAKVLGGPMINLDALFSSSQVANAAGMTATNFRSHLARGNWRILEKSKPADAFGKGHMFSIYDALGFALAHQLVSFGVDPKIAFDRAMSDFAHKGSVANSYGGYDREPGCLFDPGTLGRTLYVYSPGAERGQCVPSNKASAIELITHRDHGRASTAIIIDLNDLRDRVLRGLGLVEG